MGPRELRAGMRGPMRALGFQAGRLSFHLPLAGALRFTVSLRTTSMWGGERAAIIGLALYRQDDWVQHCLDHGHGVDREYDAGYGWMGFQAVDDLSRLLDRPHYHQWPVRDPEESRQAAASVVRCVEWFLMPRMTQIEATADALIRRRQLVSPEETEPLWLADSEPCPYGPCAELGRPTSSGGFYEDW